MAGSVLSEVRDLMPQRPLGRAEALGLIERQALRFLKLMTITEPPVPGFAIAHLPRVQVRQGPLLDRSGKTEWTGGRWLITVSDTEPWVRRRFTLAHELAHIIHHPVEDVCFPAMGSLSAVEQTERNCDYFAACLLMPRPWVKRLWGRGLRPVSLLARQFGVSQEAMTHRLRWLGLSEPVTRRCAGLIELPDVSGTDPITANRPRFLTRERTSLL